MNWRQLYTTANPHERLELMLHMLQVIERRQRRVATPYAPARTTRITAPSLTFHPKELRRPATTTVSLLVPATCMVWIVIVMALPAILV